MPSSGGGSKKAICWGRQKMMGGGEGILWMALIPGPRATFPLIPAAAGIQIRAKALGTSKGGGGFAVNFGVGSDAGSAVSAMFLMPRIQPNVTKIVLPTTPAKSPRPDIGEMEPLASIPNLDSEARFTPTRLGIHSKSKSSPSTLELVNQSESELQPTFEDAHSGPNLV
jgi:hypothetical protein